MSLGFNARLQKEEALNSGGHAFEEFHWIAFENGQFEDFATGAFAANNNDATASLAGGYTGVTLADMHATNGGDTAQLRITDQTASTLSLFVEEEQSRDVELFHIDKTVGWVHTDELIFARNRAWRAKVATLRSSAILARRRPASSIAAAGSTAARCSQT